MKVKGKNGIGSLLKILLWIGMIIGGMALLFLCPMFYWLDIKFDWFLLMIYPCGVCFFIFMYQFIGLFQMLEMNSPFCRKTISYLNKSMWLSYIISGLIFVALIFMICGYSYTLAVKCCILFIGVLFFGVGIALFILKELFREAIDYKEENDLTI